MEHSSIPDLKNFLKNQAFQRNHFATEINRKLDQLNEHPKEHNNGSTLGNIHRFWLGLKSSWGKKDDYSILEKCLRGEKASLREYKENLKKKP